MFSFITNLFTAEEVVTEEVVMSEREQMKTSSLTYQYLELYISSLSPRYNYDVMEELKSGQIIRHCTDVSYDEMKEYVRMVYIEACPPKFVITPTNER